MYCPKLLYSVCVTKGANRGGKTYKKYLIFFYLLNSTLRKNDFYLRLYIYLTPHTFILQIPHLSFSNPVFLSDLSFVPHRLLFSFISAITHFYRAWEKSHINCIPRLDYLSVPFIPRTPRCAQNILISCFFVHFSYTLLTLASSVVLPISVGSIIPLTPLFICSTPPTLAISSPSAALLPPAYLPSTPAPAAPSLRISQS